MDTKKLARILLLGGVATVLAAILWWRSFYSSVSQEVAADLSSAVHCLYASKADCQFIIMMARLGGVTPYNPIVLWAGVLGVIVGLVLIASSKAAIPEPAAMGVPAQDLPAGARPGHIGDE